jgi:hypothetical protein
VVIGIIVRLCEGSWGKSKGSLGSSRFLVAGALLSLPVAVQIVLGLLT